MYKKEVLKETEEFVLSGTGEDGDFIATIHNKTSHDVTLTVGDKAITLNAYGWMGFPATEADKKVVETIIGDSYQVLVPLENKNDEFDYILSFIKGWGSDEDNNIPDNSVFYGQLLSLWTSFCLKNNLTPDTATYDSRFRDIVKTMEETFDTSCGYVPPEIEDPAQYDEDRDAVDVFDFYLGQYLA